MKMIERYFLALNCDKRLRQMAETIAARGYANRRDPEHPDYEPLTQPKPGT